MTDLPTFFNAVRASVFDGSLTAGQVQGCEAILAACDRHGVTDPRHQANILAQVHHETGGQMLPVKETVYAYSKDRDPSDAQVIARLDAAFAKGQLTWVKTPYWRDGWFGRGMIQITHRDNYARLGEALGVMLLVDRDLALDLTVSADIAVVGMRDGIFTGKKLGDYLNATRDDPAAARAIVNGDVPKIGPEIAAKHKAFLAALVAAGAASPKPAPAPVLTVEARLAALEAWRATIEGART